MPTLVPITWLNDNPYQPRQHTSLESVERLAESIQANGLFQIPVARIIAPDGTPLDETALVGIRQMLELGSRASLALDDDYRIQIAFGHTRLKAFRRLAEGDDAFACMPVELKCLTDHQMFIMAFEENENRSSLNAIEQAEAMSRAETEFGWSHTEIAERMKLERSTVSNTIRLTRLPDTVKKQVRAGTLSKRNALALVQMADLPELLLTAAKGNAYDPDRLYKNAAAMKPEEIRAEIDRMMRFYSKPLDQFPESHEFIVPDVVSATCTTCPQRLSTGKNHYCPVETCWNTKKALYQQQSLLRASAATGLPIHDVGPKEPICMFVGAGWRDATAAMAKKCPNLRVIAGGFGGMPVEGSAGCFVACVGNGHICPCSVSYNRQHTTDAQRQREADHAAIQQTLQPAIAAIADGLKRHDLGLLKRLVVMLSYTGYIGLDATEPLYRALASIFIERFTQSGLATVGTGASRNTLYGAHKLVALLEETFSLGMDIPPTFEALVAQISLIEEAADRWTTRPGRRRVTPTHDDVQFQVESLAQVKQQLGALFRLDDVAGRIAALDDALAGVFANTPASIAA